MSDWEIEAAKLHQQDLDRDQARLIADELVNVRFGSLFQYESCCCKRLRAQSPTGLDRADIAVTAKTPPLSHDYDGLCTPGLNKQHPFREHQRKIPGLIEPCAANWKARTCNKVFSRVY